MDRHDLPPLGMTIFPFTEELGFQFFPGHGKFAFMPIFKDGSFWVGQSYGESAMRGVKALSLEPVEEIRFAQILMVTGHSRSGKAIYVGRVVRPKLKHERRSDEERKVGE